MFHFYDQFTRHSIDKLVPLKNWILFSRSDYLAKVFDRARGWRISKYMWPLTCDDTCRNIPRTVRSSNVADVGACWIEEIYASREIPSGWRFPSSFSQPPRFSRQTNDAPLNISFAWRGAFFIFAIHSVHEIVARRVISGKFVVQVTSWYFFIYL